MKVVIIGAGPAGLAAIRHCLDENIECVAFEQTEKIGGIWNYVDNSETDEYGLPVHSSMYKGLKTNLPKEIMEFEDFSYPEKENSFISQEEVLEYIHQYAHQFNLLPYVMFHHEVLLVDPLPKKKWSVQVKNLRTNEILKETYDGVIVCNGHYFDPSYPSIPGMDHFNQKSIHSHYYRKPDQYKDKRVLIIGAGPSGIDISRILVEVAKKVYLSFETKFFGNISDNIICKPKVHHFQNKIAVFDDDTEEEIDEIVYCTGYKYSFKFLSKECKITVDHNWVKPLYKHLINIEHPSMALINIISAISPFPIFGLQIRFYLALLKGHFHVSKEEMYEDLEKDRKNRDQNSLPKKKAHFIGFHQPAYCEDLAKTAHIRRIPPVVGNVFTYIAQNKIVGGYNFKILNDKEFVASPVKK